MTWIERFVASLAAPKPTWERRYAFCGRCWRQCLLWVKGNVGYCEHCRPDWRPEEE